MKHFITLTKKEFKRHGLDYLILITSGTLFLIFLKLFQGEKFFSFLILVFFVMVYIFWGIYHHVKNKNYYLKNLVEYIIIGFTIIYLLEMIVAF